MERLDAKRVFFCFAKLRIVQPQSFTIANGQASTIDLTTKLVGRKKGDCPRLDNGLIHQREPALFPEIRLNGGAPATLGQARQENIDILCREFLTIESRGNEEKGQQRPHSPTGTN